MSANVDISTGATITFATSGFTAEVTAIGLASVNRGSVDTSHFGTAAPAAGKYGNRTFIPGDLSDPGELTMEIHFNPDTTPPIDAVAEIITIQFSASDTDVTGATFVGTGFATGWDMTGPLDDKMTATLTVKWSGNITITGGTTS